MRVWGPFVIVVVIASLALGSVVALLNSVDMEFKVSAEDAYRRGVTAFERGDYPTALSWYQKAAAQNYAAAQAQIGSMYRSGKGVTQSDVEALYWYRKNCRRRGSRRTKRPRLFLPDGAGRTCAK
jgi:Sel1 repeat